MCIVIYVLSSAIHFMVDLFKLIHCVAFFSFSRLHSRQRKTQKAKQRTICHQNVGDRQNIPGYLSNYKCYSDFAKSGSILRCAKAKIALVFATQLEVSTCQFLLICQIEFEVHSGAVNWFVPREQKRQALEIRDAIQHAPKITTVVVVVIGLIQTIGGLNGIPISLSYEETNTRRKRLRRSGSLDCTAELKSY